MLKRKCFCLIFVVFNVCLHSLFAFAATTDATINNTTIDSAHKSLPLIRITDAVVYVPLGFSQSTIAFFTLQNKSGVDISITQVTSSTITKIELVPAIPRTISQSTTKATVNTIETSNHWLIPAGKTLVLHPNKQYLQLNGLRNSLRTGDELQLEVRLSDGQQLLVVAQAKSAFDQPHSH